MPNGVISLRGKTPLLDELESHLRAELRTLVATGTPEDQAFRLAVSRLGNAGPLRKEFNKLGEARCWPVTLGSWLFAALMILFAGMLSKRLVDGRLSLLLFAHIFSVTAGYGAAFLVGGFGIYCVFKRLFHTFVAGSPRNVGARRLPVQPAFGGTGNGGRGAGNVLAHQHSGKYLLGDAKEIGALCVFLWFVVFLVMQRRGLVSERVMMLMCIGGNIMVSLAWFGAAILTKTQRNPPYLPLALSVFLGIHLVFLVMGLAHAPAETLER